MDTNLHYDIVGRLETVKSAGMISDYLVSWVGTAGRLEPVVRTWISDDDKIQNTHRWISNLLDGLVCEQSITVKVDSI